MILLSLVATSSDAIRPSSRSAAAPTLIMSVVYSAVDALTAEASVTELHVVDPTTRDAALSISNRRAAKEIDRDRASR